MTALLTTHQAAQLLNIHEETVRDLVKRGVLKPVRLCRRLRFTEQAIADAITAMMHDCESSGCLEAGG